jgi:hypothetical protein
MLALAASALGCQGGRTNDLTCDIEAAGYQSTLLSCSSLSGCPSGTTCDKPDNLDAVQACPAGKCCIPEVFPQIAATKLIDGFQVAEIEFHRNGNATEGFVYEAAFTNQVFGLSCSLYVAEPEVKARPGEESRGIVANAGQCIYRSHIFRIDNARDSSLRTIQFGIADLASDESTQDARVSPGSCRSPLLTPFQPLEGVLYPPIVSTLRVGCIAFATDTIVGATRLQDVALDELPESQMVLTNCSGQDQSGISARLCMAPETIGRCAQGACQSVNAVPEEDGGAGESTTPPPSGVGDAEAPALGSTAYQELPVKVCDACSDGQACARGSQSIGRCINSLCAQVKGAAWTPPLVISNCAASFEETDGLNCYAPAVQGYGTCYAGTCRTRCVNDNHCSKRYGLISSEAHFCAHARGPDSKTASYLGICLPGRWFPAPGQAGVPAAVDAGMCTAITAGSDAPAASTESPPDGLEETFCVGEPDLGNFTCN